MIRPLRELALKPLTTFGVAATARRAWTLAGADEIDPVLEAAANEGKGLAPLILGGGSNLLIARDVDEPLILVRLAGRRVLDDDGTQVWLEIGAGEAWDDIVRWTLSKGWGGLENLTLIPGLVGAAPWQNIGAYGVEVGERIIAVNAVEMGSGERRQFDNTQCAFSYRHSFFKSSPGRRWLITSVLLQLSRRPQPRIGYGEIRHELAARKARDGGREGGDVVDSNAVATDAVVSPTPVEVAAAVAAIRRRKLPDPAVIGNAGSFFKNPIIERDVALALLAGFPAMPVYPLPDPARRKLSAAWLIEAAGWKGFRDGDAGVSAQHALVLVNHGGATGRQLLALAARIEQSVSERFGVSLEPEPVILS